MDLLGRDELCIWHCNDKHLPWSGCHYFELVGVHGIVRPKHWLMESILADADLVQSPERGFSAKL